MSGATQAYEPRFRLPPEVFDALHLSALAHGGIGATWLYSFADKGPCCVHGHANWLDGCDRVDDVPLEDPRTPTRVALNSCGLLPDANDEAFTSNDLPDDRIPFERWCELVGVDVAGAPHAV